MKYKTWLIRFALAFAIFYLFSRPAQAADAVNGVVDGIFTGANRLAAFLSDIRLS